jgi:hypothetical protein
LDLTEKYILGVYEPRVGNNSDVRGIGVFDEQAILTIIDRNKRSDIFAPRGLAFVPKNIPYLQSGDFIKCKIKEVVSQSEVNSGRHKYIIDTDTIQTHKTTLVIVHKGLVLEELGNLDLSKIMDIAHTNKLSDDTDFYLMDDSGLYGVFIYKKNTVSPKSSKFVKHWPKKKIQEHLIEHGNNTYLSECVPETLDNIDCMTSKQLSEWFREQLNLLQPSYVKQLDENTPWRTEVPKIIENLSHEQKKVEEVRFDRISDIIQLFELKIEDIKNLAENSEIFRNLYQTKIDQHKNEFLSQHITEVQAQVDQKKADLESIKNKIKQAELEYRKIEVSIQKLKPQEQLLKESLLPKITEQFQAFKEILGNSTDTISPSVCFEYKEAIGEPLSDYSKIKEYVAKIFGQYGIKQDLADALLREMFLKQAIFIPHGKVAKAVAQGFGNSQRYITSVSHRWESFSCLLKNGLSQAWKAALENPDKYIILLLQDINMAPPECWGRPLLNVISGIQDNLQSLGEWPQNLWIFATVLPTQDPAIGLPLNQDSFLGWGAISNEDWKATKEEDDSEPKHVTWDHWAFLQEKYTQQQDKLSTDDNANLEAYFQI